MKELLSIRLLALLLGSLLFTQLDPGGLVVCMADNGRVSYNLNCACDMPGEHSGPGCLACVADVPANTDSAKTSTGASCCKSSPDENIPADPDDQGCCHNFSIDLIASADFIMRAPAFTDISSTDIFQATDAWLPVNYRQRLTSFADLPPPLPDRQAAGVQLLDSVRLLL